MICKLLSTQKTKEAGKDWGCRYLNSDQVHWCASVDGLSVSRAIYRWVYLYIHDQSHILFKSSCVFQLWCNKNWFSYITSVGHTLTHLTRSILKQCFDPEMGEIRWSRTFQNIYFWPLRILAIFTVCILNIVYIRHTVFIVHTVYIVYAVHCTHYLDLVSNNNIIVWWNIARNAHKICDETNGR